MLMALLLWRLRPINILRVLMHRQHLKKGDYEARLPGVCGFPTDSFWQGGAWRPAEGVSDALRAASLERGNEIVAGVFRRFEDERIEEGRFPQWHKDSYSSQRQMHFSTVALNHVHGEDVKLCWDLSRFKWLMHLVVAAVHADKEVEAQTYLARAQALLSDWLLSNGYFQGVNWACGQEVSIRGLNLMNALMLLNQRFGMVPTEASLAFIKASCQRVEATIGYSLAQDNNHSLTESFFLYYAPVFLEHFGDRAPLSDSPVKRLRRARGTFMRLVQADGSFRMYSINYHRAVCDIISMFKVLDDALAIGFWREDLLLRVSRMHDFLQAVVTTEGHAPTIGHSDGSLHALQYAPYADHRPSLVFMGCVFSLPLYGELSSSVANVYCFGREPSFTAREPNDRLRCFDDFGLAIIRYPRYQLFLKYARNAGRPSQEDFLHADLWVDERNVLHDSGSFSYNPADPSWVDYFDAATAHNGPFFKHRNLVPRLTRFLYLEWPSVHISSSDQGDSLKIELQLAISGQVRFKRTVLLEENAIRFVDAGPSSDAWGIAFNLPRPPEAGDHDSRVALADGVFLTSDAPMHVESGLFSKRYLDRQDGTRVTIEGCPVGVTCLIEIQDT